MKCCRDGSLEGADLVLNGGTPEQVAKFDSRMWMLRQGREDSEGISEMQVGRKIKGFVSS